MHIGKDQVHEFIWPVRFKRKVTSHCFFLLLNTVRPREFELCYSLISRSFELNFFSPGHTLQSVNCRLFRTLAISNYSWTPQIPTRLFLILRYFELNFAIQSVYYRLFRTPGISNYCTFRFPLEFEIAVLNCTGKLHCSCNSSLLSVI